MESNIKIVLIICITFLLVVGIIVFGLTIIKLNENPYQSCLKSCQYSDKITCTRICTEQVSDVLENLADKFIPLIEQMLGDM